MVLLATAVRMLMRRGPEEAARHDLSALRLVASVGEPLNAEAVRWGADVLGRPVHDNWWQTETGAIMISNFAAAEIRPGSMGRPVPGIDAGLLGRGPDGRALVDADGGVRPLAGVAEGELALRAGWPSMFRGYLNDPERYAAAFADGWYLTGDIARRDAEGHVGTGPVDRGAVEVHRPRVVGQLTGGPPAVRRLLPRHHAAGNTPARPRRDLRRPLVARGRPRRHTGPACGPTQAPGRAHGTGAGDLG